MSERVHKLSTKELESVLSVMRYWPKSYMNEVAKLVHHSKWQAAEIKKLEERIRELSQADFFKQKQQLSSKVDKSEGVPLEKHPLPKRLAIMNETGKKDSDEWKMTLRWNKLTEDAANMMIIEYYKTLDM